MGTSPREELIRAVAQAKDQAKTILAALEQLAGLCSGKLAPLEAQLREAARVARGGS